MNFLFLSETYNDKIYFFLSKRGNVVWKKEKLPAEFFKSFDWIVSYGYRHLFKSDVINNVKNPIINLHISYLPFNRGAHPNYWSFKEKTPKGVSIHFIDEGIDTGPIIIQKKSFFVPSDTLNSSYLKLKEDVEQLFFRYFDDILENKIKAKPQINKGTYHKKSDLPKEIYWEMNINDVT